MTIKLFLYLTLLISGFSDGLEIPEDFEASVASLVDIFMQSNTAPGVGLAVVTADGNLTFTRGYGLRNMEENVAVTENSLFCIASISKSFAATIVAKVLNEKFPELGEPVLDAPIVQLAPALNFSLSDRVRAESMSFRDLLSHHTCLSPSTLGRTFGAFETKAEYIYRTRYAPQICPFRTGYTYNNNMFALAGETIAAISGVDNYADVLSSFLNELGMVNSRVINKEENYGTLLNMALPYYLNLDKQLTPMNPDLLRRSFFTLGSGGVVTSPEDMTKYLLFHLNNGLVGGQQVVPAVVLRRVKRPTNPFNFQGFQDGNNLVDGDFAYALGLNIGFFEGQQLISHDGYWAPYASRMSLYPSMGLGIFSSANGPGRLTGQTFTDLHNAIASLLQGSKSFEEIKKEFANKHNSKQQHTKTEFIPPVPIKSLKVDPIQAAGIFGNPFHGDLEIVYNASNPENSLSLNYGIWGRGFLRQSSSAEDVLEWEIDSDVVGDFLSQADSVPLIPLQFVDNDTFILNFGELFTFKRDPMLIYPIYPPESCSPPFNGA